MGVRMGTPPLRLRDRGHTRRTPTLVSAHLERCPRVSNAYRPPPCSAAQLEGQLSGISMLDFDDSRAVDAAAAAHIGRALALCDQLHTLQLASVPGFDDRAAAVLWRELSVGAASDGPYSNRLLKISLDGNGLGDKALTALAAAVNAGALRCLGRLSLGRNRIGTVGVSALALASRTPGRLDSLTHLNLYSNRLGDRGVAALAAETERGAFANLRLLYLGGNAISTAGARRLIRAAAEHGALDQLTTLHLYRNDISKLGATALGRALHEWALPHLTMVTLDGNPLITNRAARFVIDALQRREFARIQLHRWHDLAHARLLRRLHLRAAQGSAPVEGVANSRSSKRASGGSTAVPRKLGGNILAPITQWHLDAIVPGN